MSNTSPVVARQLHERLHWTGNVFGCCVCAHVTCDWKPSNQSVMCLVRTGIGNLFEGDFWWVTGFGQNPPRTTWYEVSTKCCLWKSNQQNQHLPCRKLRNTKLPFYLNICKLVLELYQGLSLPVLMLHRHEMPWVPLPTMWCLKHAFHCTLCIWIFRNLAFCLGRKRVAGREGCQKSRGAAAMPTFNWSHVSFSLEWLG